MNKNIKRFKYNLIKVCAKADSSVLENISMSAYIFLLNLAIRFLLKATQINKQQPLFEYLEEKVSPSF